MRFRLILTLALISSAAFAQQKSVVQSGNITPNTVPWYISSGVIGGGVTSADSPITSFGVTSNGNLGICDNSDRITAAGRNTICLRTSTNGHSQIVVQNYGAASAQPLDFVINGTAYTFPFNFSSGVVGPSTSTVGDLVIWNNTTGSLVKDSNVLPNGTTATTQSAGDSTTKVATTSFVQTAVDTVCTYATSICVSVFGYNNIKWYGADPTGSTDSTSAIQSALTNATSAYGGSVFIPPGNYSITSSNACIFNVTNGYPFAITGVGQPSNLRVATGTSTSTDVLCVAPTFATSGYIFRDFAINTQTAGNAQHAIHFTTTGATAAVLSDVLIDNLYLGAVSGYDIYAQGESNNTSGSINYSVIRNSILQRPINLLYAGDGVRVESNTIVPSGSGDQITVSQVAGSAGLVVEKNVLAGPGGCIVLNAGQGAVIENNECENTTGSGSANGAMIDVAGATATVNDAKINGNNITCTNSCTATSEIRTAATATAVVDANRVFNISGNHFVNTSAASSTIYGPNNQCSSNGTLGCTISDSGTGTLYGVTAVVPSQAKPTISSGFGGGTPSISAPNGWAAFRVTIGTATGSTGVLTMPTAPTGWNCVANDITTHTTSNAFVMQTAGSVSSVTLTGYSDVIGAATWVASDVIAIQCAPY